MESKELNSYELSMLLTEKEINNPQVGDIFHEMLSFMVYVVEVDSEIVKVITSTGELKILNRVAFKKWLSYGNIPGYWVLFLRNDIERTSSVLERYLNQNDLKDKRDNKINYLNV